MLRTMRRPVLLLPMLWLACASHHDAAVPADTPVVVARVAEAPPSAPAASPPCVCTALYERPAL